MIIKHCVSRLLRPGLAGRLHTCMRQPVSPEKIGVRTLSTATDGLVRVSMNEKTGVATMQMARKPVNSFSLEMLTELVISLEKLENEKGCRGLIITSAFPEIFSAGLDIMEMYQPQEARLREFWRAVQEMWLRFYGCRMPVIAAINGHSPAGGCLLALCADYRIMASGKYKIGLNETLLGIVAPFWLKDTMVNAIGHQKASKSLQLGLLYKSAEAQTLGLVDRVVDTVDQVLPAAEEEIVRWISIPALAQKLSKQSMRKDTIENMLSGRDQDLEDFVGHVLTDEAQGDIALYLKSLKKKK